VQARWRRKVTRALPPARRPGSHIAEPTHRGPGAPRRGDAHPPAPPRSASRRVSVSVSRESGRKRSHSTLTRRRRRVTTAARSERRQTIRRFPDSGAWTNRCTTWHVHSCLTSPGSPDSRLRLPGRLHGLRQAPASCDPRCDSSQSHSRRSGRDYFIISCGLIRTTRGSLSTAHAVTNPILLVALPLLHRHDRKHMESWIWNTNFALSFTPPVAAAASDPASASASASAAVASASAAAPTWWAGTRPFRHSGDHL